ncbi:alpha/beta hydrolase [Actinomadura atramentaria]|uniref:alpha/beta hydrolase n=1 Tax=Actinomadura atramentaria TaxID=1990 RepID=UPI00037A22EC|nr:alpha/beta fold hydrolase [Actinomadura atramentaria]
MPTTPILAPRRRGTALAAAVAALLAVLAALVAPPARADAPAPPTLPDGFGLTQVPTEPEIAARNTANDFVITVTTPQVAGRHHIRIILPDGYAADTAKRYPVMYLLHGSPGDPANYFNGYRALNGQAGMIFVLPDGGNRGWYSNWRDQNTPAGAQNWENFHIDQLVPYIDANLRTVADKQHRAIAGISMGGFGALHYAQLHPDLFSDVATMSGDNDLSVNSMDLRLTVVGSLIDATGALCAASTLSDPTADCAVNDAYAPAVDSDALFGSPYPVLNADHLWNEADPGANAAKLAGLGVSIYIGNGGGGVFQAPIGPKGLEWWLEGASKHFKDKLDAAGVPYYWKDYGDGTGWGQCDGGHDALCWDQDLVDYVPRLAAKFGV